MKSSVKLWVTGAAVGCSLIGVEIWRRCKLQTPVDSRLKSSRSAEGLPPFQTFSCTEWPNYALFDWDAALISIYKSQGKFRNDFMMEAYLARLLKATLSAAKTIPSTQCHNARSKISMLESLGIDSHWLGSDILNAYAVGLNHIFVHSKVLSESKSELELNLVLGHELGHLVCQHTDLMLKDLVLNGGGIGSFVHCLNYRSYLLYSRNLEFQADKFGFDCLVGLGYNPLDLCEGLGVLMRSETIKYHELSPERSSELEMLQTHPLSFMRINRLRDYAKKLPSCPSKPEPLDFQLLKLRETLLHSGGAESCSASHFENLKQAQGLQAQAQACYGLALTYLRNHEFKKACQALEDAPKLLQESPFGWELKFLIHQGLKKPWSSQAKQQAIQSFEKFYGPEWGERFGARLDLFEGKADAALQRLKTIPASARWGHYWHELAQAYHAAGKPALCRWAMAEHHACQGNLKAAQLEFGRLLVSSELNAKQKGEVLERQNRLRRLIAMVGI